MDDQLFDTPDPKRFIEPHLTPADRTRRMARRSDPQTSWDAIPSKKALTKTKQRILNLLAEYSGGLTSSQVAHLLDIDKGSSSKRLGDLEHEMYVETAGLRLSDRGRMSTIYRIKK